MEKLNKVKVTAKDKDDNEVVLIIKRPNYKQMTDAQSHANKVFAKIRKDAIPRECLNDQMREWGFWDDDKEKRNQELEKLIYEGEVKLQKGKSGGLTKLSEAYELAKKVREYRIERLVLNAKRYSMDSMTIEGQIENAKFDYLVYSCTYDEEGNQVFETLDDYIDKSDEPYAQAAAAKLSSLVYGLDEDYDKNLPENKFLQKYGLVDDKLRLVNKEGRLIDTDGNLIDDEGYQINEDGKRVDVLGNELDDEGNVVVDNYEMFDNDLNL